MTGQVFDFYMSRHDIPASMCKVSDHDTLAEAVESGRMVQEIQPFCLFRVRLRGQAGDVHFEPARLDALPLRQSAIDLR